EQLKREVLEGERRTVEELQNMGLLIELHQWRNRLVVEAAVGVAHHPREGISRQVTEEGEEGFAQISIAQLLPILEEGRDIGKLHREVEPAIWRQAR